MIYYNEIDSKKAAWLRELIKAGAIADGIVDERSIEDVRPDELMGYTQCHFFAGIGAWSYALRCAGWPDERPVWTGSCPCQPFSAAGKRSGTADERHLWPAWYHLIEICRPATVFGEQVASKDGLAWLDLVHADLEGQGYAVGCLDLCAAGFGAPHIRQRLYFVADAGSERRQQNARGPSCDEEADGREGRVRSEQDGDHESTSNGPVGLLADAAVHGYAAADGVRETTQPSEPTRENDQRELERGGNSVLLADATGGQREQLNGPQRDGIRRPADDCADRGELGDTSGQGFQEQRGIRGTSPGQDESVQGEAIKRAGSSVNGFWRDAVWLPCRDGKARPTQPGIFPLAHGAAARVVRLRGYGDAIVAPVAEEFIRAYMMAREEKMRM